MVRASVYTVFLLLLLGGGSFHRHRRRHRPDASTVVVRQAQGDRLNDGSDRAVE
jgi:hypothetical protein